MRLGTRKPRSLFNQRVSRLRWGPHRLRFLTPEERQEWDQRIAEIVEKRARVTLPDPVWERIMRGLA